MGKVAFVFPGQGSQKVGMGREAFESSDLARAVFDEADEALGEPISKLCFEGPEESLQLTANTQPAVLTASIAILRALDAPFDVVAGHSLGEYSAHVAAGTLRLADAVRLVRKRGQYMQEAVPYGEGAMAAVLKADRTLVERICAEVPGLVEAVNYNSPQQIVIAGETAAVSEAGIKLKEAGARSSTLPVSAPFHSTLMEPAEERLREDIGAIAFSKPRVPVYVNVDAVPLSDLGALKEALIRQVSRPVLWEESVRRMIDDGVSLFVEVGPGRVLSGLLARIDKRAGRVSVQGPSDFDPAREAIEEARAS
ncbi:MAG TPA: ACP S-malonyltransferase [Polyangiales bacterium]|nr:ACP S-malonyltransferase [Polyangiales bacterium]